MREFLCLPRTDGIHACAQQRGGDSVQGRGPRGPAAAGEVAVGGAAPEEREVGWLAVFCALCHTQISERAPHPLKGCRGKLTRCWACPQRLPARQSSLNGTHRALVKVAMNVVWAKACADAPTPALTAALCSQLSSQSLGHSPTAVEKVQVDRRALTLRSMSLTFSIAREGRPSRLSGAAKWHMTSAAEEGKGIRGLTGWRRLNGDVPLRPMWMPRRTRAEMREMMEG